MVIQFIFCICYHSFWDDYSTTCYNGPWGFKFKLLYSRLYISRM